MRNMLLLAGLLVSPVAVAQMPMNMPMDHSAHMTPPAENEVTRAFHKSDDDMMRGMGAPLSGDADRDFVSSMVPHHQGALDMARIELQYGRDPEMRALAESIIKSQQPEIDQMQHWQAAHPK